MAAMLLVLISLSTRFVLPIVATLCEQYQAVAIVPGARRFGSCVQAFSTVDEGPSVATTATAAEPWRVGR